MQKRHYATVIKLEDDGRYSAHVPELPGCASWGHTIDQARGSIREAIEIHVARLRADGRSIPEPLGGSWWPPTSSD